MTRRLHIYVATLILSVAMVWGAQAQTVVGLFFSEGWESGTMSQSFNSAYYGSAAPPQFSVTNLLAGSGVRSLRHHVSAGMSGDDVAYATQHFGDARSSPVWPTGAGQHFFDVYVQYKVLYSSNWDTSTGPPKSIEFGTEDDRIHTEVCCNPGFANYVAVYPAFGNDWNVEVVNKQGPGPEWIAYRQNSSGYNSSNIFRMQTGRWYTIEVRRKLNDANVDNGVLQMWVDGVLLLNYTNVRFRVPRNGSFGANFSYGTNWVMISDYGSMTRDQDVYYDDFKLSTTYIGTGAAAPQPPTNLRIIR